MPFTKFVNAQQIEVVVAGPGDITRLYVCKGLAQGSLSITVPAQQGMSQTDNWQFEVGPQLDANQFRRAIASVALAGLSEIEEPEASATWEVQAVIADFDDDAGKVRVTATNLLSISNPSVALEYAGLTTLAYDVSILAA